ncbi:hypothetical protein Hanom_Chr10g00904561 [Helianthus anomalus]
MPCRTLGTIWSLHKEGAGRCGLKDCECHLNTFTFTHLILMIGFTFNASATYLTFGFWTSIISTVY